MRVNCLGQKVVFCLAWDAHWIRPPSCVRYRCFWNLSVIGKLGGCLSLWIYIWAFVYMFVLLFCPDDYIIVWYQKSPPTCLELLFSILFLEFQAGNKTRFVELVGWALALALCVCGYDGLRCEKKIMKKWMNTEWLTMKSTLMWPAIESGLTLEVTLELLSCDCANWKLPWGSVRWSIHLINYN